MTPANYVSFTAPINPEEASPVLTRAQVWAGLEKKIRAGQDFVGGAITATDVIKEYKTEAGLPVTERDVHFKDASKGTVREKCIAFKPTKVEFHQPRSGNGGHSKVQNIIGQGAGGDTDLYMTYDFEWLHPELEGKEEELAAALKQEQIMAKKAVESTISVMRKMVSNGQIQ